MDWITPSTTRCTFPVFFSNTSRSSSPRNARLIGVTSPLATVCTASLGCSMIGSSDWALAGGPSMVAESPAVTTAATDPRAAARLVTALLV